MMMHQFKILGFCLLSLCSFIYSNGQGKNNVSAGSVLEKVSKPLNNLKVVSYVYQRELFYYSENIENKLSGRTYLVFTEDDSIGFTYQFVGDDHTSIYNGGEAFVMDKKTNEMTVRANPHKNAFNSTPFFYNSLLTLRNLLPVLLADKEISLALRDTTVAAKEYFLVGFSLHKKALGYITGTRPLSMELTKVYSIMIDKQSMLPFQIIERNSINGDFTRTTFAEINIAPTPPAENSWFYSSYQPQYNIKKTGNKTHLVETGLIPANWKLPAYGQAKDSIRLDQYKGKVVMLDFWIKNCGYCQAAFPYLQSMKKKFANKPFELLAINAYDSQKDIAFFYNKFKPEYPFLFNGRELSARFGIEAYPTVILLDKEGKVIYAGYYEEDLITGIIKENL